MKTFALFLALTVLALQPGLAQPPAWADQVTQASGSAAWPKVAQLEFTFRVVADGKEKVAAHHQWDLAAHTDTVSWAGKTVTIDLEKTPATADEKAAFQRWTNDSYWLLAPLKLKDRGTNVSYAESITKDGKELGILDLSFQQVGLTPGDKYRYYIDPATSLPAAWDYMPNTTTTKYATWEKYETSGGLTLSTYHRMGNTEIFIDGLKVTPAQ